MSRAAALAEPDRTAVVVLSGEYDIARAEELVDSIAARWHGASLVVLDVEALTFIDSSGLRALIDVWSMLRGQRIALELRSPGLNMRRLLQITASEHLFGVSP